MPDKSKSNKHKGNELENIQWSDRTLSVRHGNYRSNFNEHSEALFLTSSFVFDDAQRGAELFADPSKGNVYTRFTNPTVDALAHRMALLERAEFGLVTSSGMSAIMALCLALLKQGDHVLCSRDIFGTSVGLFRDIMTRFGVDVDFVPLTDTQSWERGMRANTRFLFCETPSNPLLEVVDLTEMKKLAEQNGALLIVDNTVATPILQKPICLGADVVMHSMTKFVDGGGRCLGGSIVTNDKGFYDKIFSIIRSTGPSLSPFNAWVLLKSLETLPIRVQEHCKSAEVMVKWLEQQNWVSRVYHPSAKHYRQKDIVDKQMSASGALLSFVVQGGKESAWNLIDQCKLFSKTANLGDARSTICHPATTTHCRLTQQMRDDVGISDSLVRISVGLEDPKDLCADLNL